MVVTQPVGSFALVLHSHLPWLPHHGAWPVGEEWLHQAWGTSYTRLFDLFEQLAARGRTDVATIGITPVLAAQLDDPYCVAQQHTWLADWQLRAWGQWATTGEPLAADEYRQAGQAISIDPALVAGRSAPAIDADLTVDEALSRALADTPLDVVRTANGTLSLRDRPALRGSTSAADTAGASGARPTTVLPAVTVDSRRYNPVDLPDAYAGGQVARGGSLGLLGNVDALDAPVSIMLL